MTVMKKLFLLLVLVVGFVFPQSVIAAQGGQVQPDRLRLGVVVAADDTARDRVEPFRQALEDIADLPVDLFLMQTMADGIEALASGKIDYIRLSPSGYAATFQLCECVEPLVTAGPDDFPARFYAIMIGRRGETPANLENLRHQRLAVGGKHAVAGYRVPVANLAADGIDVREYFDALVEVRNPVEGIRAILDGRVQASLGWSSLAGEAKNGFTSGTLNDYYLSGGSGFEDLEIIWRSPPIPYSAHTIRSDLPDVLKRTVRAGLMDLRREQPAAYLAIEPDLPGGFEPVGHADYRPVLRTYEIPSSGGGTAGVQ
ncbi:phosphate ABC transporter substrate-binding protein [Labrenzia sp. PHM005]|nr:phosphate ABC transporter substrate-binding protein [Labrenzia sp. PHM005]